MQIQRCLIVGRAILRNPIVKRAPNKSCKSTRLVAPKIKTRIEFSFELLGFLPYIYQNLSQNNAISNQIKRSGQVGWFEPTTPTSFFAVPFPLRSIEKAFRNIHSGRKGRLQILKCLALYCIGLSGKTRMDTTGIKDFQGLCNVVTENILQSIKL